MKPIMFRKSLLGLIAVGLLSYGNSSLAANEKDIVDAIKDLDTYGKGNSTIRDKIEKSNDELKDIRKAVEDHLQLVDKDYRNKEVVSALINYMAEQATKKYELDKELLFMNAPGVADAISATLSVDYAATREEAAKFSSNIFRKSISVFWPSADGTENDRQQLGDPKVQFLNDLMSKIKESDSDNFDLLNAGAILRQNEVDMKTAESFLGLMVNPNATINNRIATSLRENGLEGLSPAEQQEVAETLFEIMKMAPTVEAFSDIFARRAKDSKDENKPTVTEMMNNYGKLRFESPEWYRLIGKASDTAILREISHMMAYNMWVQQESFRVKEQQLALLATLNANFNNFLISISGILKQQKEAEQRAEAARAASQIRDDVQLIDENVEQ